MIDYKALAERVAQRAIYADNNADPNNKAWAADLRTVVSLLNGMADAQPFFWIGPVTRDAITTLKKSGRETLPDMTLILKGPRAPLTNLVGLYLHPAPTAPQAEPKRPAFLDEIDRAKEHVASWPQWMKDATVSAAATLPVTEPKREPLSDWRIGELYRQWLKEPRTTTLTDLMRSVERAHRIGGSDE